MATFGYDQTGRGYLDVRKEIEGRSVAAFFIPTDSPDEGSAAPERLDNGVKIVDFDLETGTLKMYPINTLSSHEDYLGSKYTKIRTLTLHADVVEDYYFDSPAGPELSFEMLPRGFVKDFNYGLGLLKDFNRLIRLIEKCTLCNEIVFVDGDNVAVEKQRLLLGLGRFNTIDAEIRRINDRGTRATGRVKDTFVHNNLASDLGISTISYSLGRHPNSRVIAKAADGIEELSSDERDALVGAVVSESAAIAAETPEKLQQLRRDIELVSLDQLIATYANDLEQVLPERHWQAFFENNAFALQQVFGSPMVSVQSGAHTGGRGISGSGDKIADYLFKNSLTNNVALVEIKRPTTQLLGADEYRGGVFGPSKELNRAITQVLDQAYNLAKSLPGLKDNSKRWDLESYAVSCFVVIGRTPSAADPDKQKSFELFRANSRNVTIATYDEILERLKLLRSFLSPS